MAVFVGTMQCAIDIFYSNYAGANVRCNYAVFEVLLQLCGTFCYFYVGGSFCCNYAGGCFCCNYAVEVSAAFMQVKVSAANIWVTIFIETVQISVSARSLCCNHGGSIFYSALCT